MIDLSHANKDVLKEMYYYKPINDFQEDWIKEHITPQCISFQEKLGYFLCDRINRDDKKGPEKIWHSNKAGQNALSSSQMRNIFGEIKRIEMLAGKKGDRWKESAEVDFWLLKPKLAYSASRSKHWNKIQHLAKVLDEAHSQVKTWKQFKNFSQFVEGILAYHKYYGGND